jgi:glycosyltransferase involved in cell wall biosynthesis
MEGEHFGIAPMEALASGCITLVHNSGGSGDFIPPELRWESLDDLRHKISMISTNSGLAYWKEMREQSRRKIAALKPKNFEEQVWFNVEKLMGQA